MQSNQLRGDADRATAAVDLVGRMLVGAPRPPDPHAVSLIDLTAAAERGHPARIRPFLREKSNTPDYATWLLPPRPRHETFPLPNEPMVELRRACSLLVSACLFTGAQVARAQSPGSFSSHDLPIPTGPLQPLAVAESLAQGRRDLDAQRWIPASRRLRWALERAPLNGEDWRSQMRAAYGARDWASAQQASERAYRLGTRDQREVALFAAASYGQSGSLDRAFSWLRRALVDERFEFRSSLDEDPDFTPLKRDPRWAALVRPPAPPTARVEGWRTDIAWLMSELERLNAPVREQPVPDTVRALAARLSADVPRLSDAAVTVRLMQLLAVLGRGHNGLFPWMASRHGALNQAPVAFFVFAGGDVRIVRASPSYERLIGYRVKQVGDLPTLAALELIGSVVERENDMDLLWRGPEFLASPSVLHLLGATTMTDSLRLVVEGRRGDSIVVLPAGPFARRRNLGANPKSRVPPPMALRRAAPSKDAWRVGGGDMGSEAPFWLEWIPAERVQYMSFTNVLDAKSESLQSFGGRLARVLDARRPAAVVVDLRRNNGGDTYLYRSLLRTLVAWDARNPGRLYALIGRNTYSAAQNFITDLDRLTDVVFVGEPSGSKPATHGNESPITLPWSGLQGGLSAVYWQIGDARDKRRWIAPAVFVPPAAQDWLSNRDAAMEVVLTHVRKR
jgi:hypothetical protein